MKKFFKSTLSKVWIIVCSILNVILITANILGQFGLHDLFINVLGKRNTVVFGDGIYYESDYENKDDSFEKSNKINEEINEEGITLLKNKNNALPLKKGSKVSVFGKNSVNLSYGGSGSGSFEVTKETPTLYQSLEKAGFEFNPTLKKFYDSNEKSGKGRPKSPKLDNGRNTIAGFATGETPYSSYTEEIKASYQKYHDAAIVVFSRIGGESYDLPRTMKDTDGALNEKDHYLELDKNEQELLVNVCNAFDKVVVVINSSTQMELGFLDEINDNDDTLVPGMENIHDKIQACVWIGGPGYSGIFALGRILNGEVTPSGRTVDTYQRDFSKDPTYQNFADNLVNNGNTYLLSDGTKPSITEHYVDYEEGIYLGYRYYETRGKADDTWYKNNVVFPFGYGLSYTDFEWKLKSASFNSGEELSWDGENDKDFSVTVSVKNTGTTYSGKDVVEVYLTAPYKKGEIEKPAVQLVGFAKTPLLAPGQEADVEVKFSGYDFASYDYSDANKNGFKGYELDPGEYCVQIMKNAHECVIDRTFNLKEGVRYEKDKTTKTKVENRFDDVSFEEKYGMESVLSRNDFDGTFPKNEVLSGSDAERTITPEFHSKITSTETNNPIVNDTTIQTPTQAEVGSPSGTLQLYDLIEHDEENKVKRDSEGTIMVDYDDPRWDEYLNLLTVDEMMDFIMKGNFRTTALPSIGLLDAFATDGPVGFVFFMAAIKDQSPVYKTCSYASECVIAATWNVELAKKMGVSIGNEAIIGNEKADGRPYSGWYAPAVNLHRTPFGGRNFEYYSEDPTLSGKLACEVIKGARSKGVYCHLKHFAVNEQETNRSGICTWLTEQSLRELYLKPFEMAVKDGGTLGIMSSFNRIGTTWTGGDYRLLTSILRDEWGFKGMVICDFNTEPFMDTRQMAYAGGDLNLATLPSPWKATSAQDLTILRQCTKNIIYTTARSNAMNGCGEGGYYVTYYAWWEVLLFFLEIGVLAVTVLWGFLCFYLNYRRNKQQTTVEVSGDKKD